MLYRIAADGLVLFHLLFILFVLLGGLLVLKWRHLAWWCAALPLKRRR